MSTSLIKSAHATPEHIINQLDNLPVMILSSIQKDPTDASIDSAIEDARNNLGIISQSIKSLSETNPDNSTLKTNISTMREKFQASQANLDELEEAQKLSKDAMFYVLDLRTMSSLSVPAVSEKFTAFKRSETAFQKSPWTCTQEIASKVTGWIKRGEQILGERMEETGKERKHNSSFRSSFKPKESNPVIANMFHNPEQLKKFGLNFGEPPRTVSSSSVDIGSITVPGSKSQHDFIESHCRSLSEIAALAASDRPEDLTDAATKLKTLTSTTVFKISDKEYAVGSRVTFHLYMIQWVANKGKHNTTDIWKCFENLRGFPSTSTQRLDALLRTCAELLLQGFELATVQKEEALADKYLSTIGQLCKKNDPSGQLVELCGLGFNFESIRAKLKKAWQI